MCVCVCVCTLLHTHTHTHTAGADRFCRPGQTKRLGKTLWRGAAGTLWCWICHRHEFCAAAAAAHTPPSDVGRKGDGSVLDYCHPHFWRRMFTSDPQRGNHAMTSPTDPVSASVKWHQRRLQFPLESKKSSYNVFTCVGEFYISCGLNLEQCTKKSRNTTDTPFPRVKNPSKPAKIALLCSVVTGTLPIYTRVNGLCSSRRFFLTSALHVNVRPGWTW